MHAVTVPAAEIQGLLVYRYVARFTRETGDTPHQRGGVLDHHEIVVPRLLQRLHARDHITPPYKTIHSFNSLSRNLLLLHLILLHVTEA